MAVLLLAGTVSAGFIAYNSNHDAEEVSDYFYLQIYNSDNQVVSKYRVTLTGMVSSASREITSVSFDLVSGDVCETDYAIDGNGASVTITHPTEGYLLRIFALGASGVFYFV